ncbi:MAG: hypothetical protein Q9219_001832 [cf. Caloplaca sp. 3 TL-2023]
MDLLSECFTDRGRIKNNISLNHLNDDVLLEICAALKHSWASLQAFAATNKRVRLLAAPTLFKSITIGRDWDWLKALRSLDSLALTEAAGYHAKQFTIDLYIGEGGPKPPSRFPLVLLKALTDLPNLEKITLIIPVYHTFIFRESFEYAKACFPSVHALVLGPYMDWMIALCPNVKTISSHDWRWLHCNVDGQYPESHSIGLIQSAGRATNLQHFEMINWWTVERLHTVHRAMPWIRSLAMPGGSYHDSIEDLLPTLTLFQDLTSLVLANVSLLKAGFNPPRCGNVYMRPGGEKRRQQVHEQGLQAEEKVAKMVFARLPKLERLWIGDSSEAKVSRTDSGAVCKVSWDYNLRRTV